MSDPFIGEIIMFGGNFAPRGWALCDGQLLPISQNTALFSILGTTYGGDGRTTFGLPDLRSRTPVHAGNGPGLSTIRLGEKSGNEITFLNTVNLPPHSHGHDHDLLASSGEGETGEPSNQILSKTTEDIYHSAGSDTALSPNSISNDATATGGRQGFSNRGPFMAVYFIIALQGTFPSRN